MHKLKCYGFGGKAIQLTASYLFLQKQYVQIRALFKKKKKKKKKKEVIPLNNKLRQK